jgi:hypothetical protein
MITNKWKDGNPYFHVLFLARSGSHMLVNALNHHPQLNVTHVDNHHHGKGNVLGHATNVPRPDGIKKAILLTRNQTDRLLSMRTSLKSNGEIGYHTKEPIKVHRTKQGISTKHSETQHKRDVRLRAGAARYADVLEISYEELTGNKDIREIPREWAIKICDFLGIEYHPMPIDFYKPEVI